MRYENTTNQYGVALLEGRRHFLDLHGTGQQTRGVGAEGFRCILRPLDEIPHQRFLKEYYIKLQKLFHLFLIQMINK